MLQEAKMLSRTRMPSVEEGLNQQNDYPRIPLGEAIVLGPLAKGNFNPEVILIYGNPVQIMMLMCGLQKFHYERFDFHFIGEGACVDSLGQCYNTGGGIYFSGEINKSTLNLFRHTKAGIEQDAHLGLLPFLGQGHIHRFLKRRSGADKSLR